MTAADKVKSEIMAMGARKLSGREANLVASLKNMAINKMYIDAARLLIRGFLVTIILYTMNTTCPATRSAHPAT